MVAKCCQRRIAASRIAKAAARKVAVANARRVVAINSARQAKGEAPLSASQLRRIDRAAAKAAAPKKTTVRAKGVAAKQVGKSHAKPGQVKTNKAPCPCKKG